MTKAIGGGPHERSPERIVQRNGHRSRILSTTAGDLEFVVAASQVLDGGVPGADHSGRAELLQPTHRRSVPQSTSEEQAGRREISLLGGQHVDHLPELVNGPVQVDPPARDPDVGLVDEPPVAGGVSTRPGSVNEQRG